MTKMEKIDNITITQLKHKIKGIQFIYKNCKLQFSKAEL